jgi:predicted RNA-binding Zn ribbon-like protein
MVLPDQIKAHKRPRFLFLGGHPAVDFANTLLPPPGPDIEFLRSWQDVIDWIEAVKLSKGEDLRLSELELPKALETVRNLRDEWKKVLEGIMAGSEVPGVFVVQLNAILRTDGFHDMLHQDGKKGLSLHRSLSVLKGLDLALALLAHTIAEFLAMAQIKYLRRCANSHSCVLSFYDTTKNHRRQWCSNATCGNRNKVAEFRRRQSKPRNH